MNLGRQDSAATYSMPLTAQIPSKHDVEDPTPPRNAALDYARTLKEADPGLRHREALELAAQHYGYETYAYLKTQYARHQERQNATH